MHNHLDHVVYSLEGGKLNIDFRVKNSQVGNPNCLASLL